MLLYYITDRKQFHGTASNQESELLRRIEQAVAVGVDLIQLREKDLPAREFERLAGEARSLTQQSRTKLLINSRLDVALAVAADGVHLTSQDLSASEARAIWAQATRSTQATQPTIAVSCHSVADVRLCESHGADFAVLAPVFEKVQAGLPGIGLEELRRATRINSTPDRRVEAGDNRVGVPVLALGGVSLKNAAEGIRAGAAGIAGIRLFQEGNLSETVRRLRELSP